MIRIAIAIGITAALGCNHPSSLGDRQPQPSVVADSNYVSGDELWADMREGHTNLYDALQSTRPNVGAEQAWTWYSRIAVAGEVIQSATSGRSSDTCSRTAPRRVASGSR